MEKIYIYCDRFPNITYTKNIINPDKTLENVILEYLNEHDNGLYYTDYNIYNYDNFFEYTQPCIINKYTTLKDLSTNKLYVTIF